MPCQADVKKVVAIDTFNKAKAAYMKSLDGLLDAYSGVRPLINQGKFKEAEAYLDSMPDCSPRTLMLMNIYERADGVVDYLKHPLKIGEKL